MKKIFIITMMLTSLAAFSQAGRLQVGLLADITDTRVVDLTAHPTIRYFVTNKIQVGVSGLYKSTNYTPEYKYLNIGIRYYIGSNIYGQGGINADFNGNNPMSLQVGYTSNFGRMWFEPYVNYSGIWDDDLTQINIGIGIGLSLN